MSMRTIRKLDELHVSELERIRTTLWRRFNVGKTGNIVEIAFGAAEKEGELDQARPDAICFYVRRKRTPRAKADRIAKSIEVRIRRENRFCVVCMPTDVIDIGQGQIEPSGKTISHQQGATSSTTGCVVAWKLPGQTQLSWGVLSTGHSFAHVRRVPETRQNVLIESATSPPHRFRGTLLARSRARDGSQIDAALILVERSSLVRAAFVRQNTSTTGKRIRSVAKMKTDRRHAGYSYPEETRIPFVVARYLPISTIVKKLGSLRHVIEVNGPDQAFQPGRSGSLWVVANQVTSLQHGGLKPSYQRGWGQSLEAVLTWCIAQIAAINHIPPSHVDLRLIRVI